MDDVPSAEQSKEEEATSVAIQENTTEGFVAGKDFVLDDFDDEGVVDFNSHNQSLAAGLWQAILWADGALESNGTAFDTSDIDCDFGSNTIAATKSWQSTHELSQDGSAGPQTFRKASLNLRVVNDGASSDQVVYIGSLHKLQMIRNGDSGNKPHAYQAIGTDGTLRVISYGFSATCSSSIWLGCGPFGC